MDIKVKSIEDLFVIYEKGKFAKPIAILDICQIQDLEGEIEVAIEEYKEKSKP